MKQVISIGKYTGIRKVANFGDSDDEQLWMNSHIDHMKKEGYRVVQVVVVEKRG